MAPVGGGAPGGGGDPPPPPPQPAANSTASKQSIENAVFLTCFIYCLLGERVYWVVKDRVSLSAVTPFPSSATTFQ